MSLSAGDNVRDHEIAGLKLTFTVHEAPTLSDDPQVLLGTAKFPVAVIELIVTLAEPLFLRVTVFEALVVLTSSELKLRVCGVGVTMGALATVKGNAPKAAQAAPEGKFSTKICCAPGVVRSADVIATGS